MSLMEFDAHGETSTHEWEKKRKWWMLYYEVRDCFDEKVEKTSFTLMFRY